MVSWVNVYSHSIVYALNQFMDWPRSWGSEHFSVSGMNTVYCPILTLSYRAAVGNFHWPFWSFKGLRGGVSKLEEAVSLPACTVHFYQISNRAKAEWFDRDRNLNNRCLLDERWNTCYSKGTLANPPDKERFCFIYLLWWLKWSCRPLQLFSSRKIHFL